MDCYRGCQTKTKTVTAAYDPGPRNKHSLYSDHVDRVILKSKAEKASALASLYKYATVKKKVYICFLKAFQTFDGKFTTAYGNMFF